MRICKVLFSIFIIIALIILFLWAVKTPITAWYFSAKLKTQVSISKVAFARDHLTINNFKIKNPKKTKIKYAFIADEILVNYSFSNIFSSPSIINNISLENVKVNIECKNPICTNNNWTKIISNMNEKSSKKDKEIIIQKLIIKNMDIEIANLGLNFNKTKKTHIAQLEFNDVSNKKGFPIKEIIIDIFRSAGLKDYLKGIMETKDAIDNIIDIFKGVSEQAVEESFKSF